jgi:hypothetical protein
MKVIEIKGEACNECGSEIKGKHYSCYDYDQQDDYVLCDKCIEPVAKNAIQSALRNSGCDGRCYLRINYISFYFRVTSLNNSDKKVLEMDKERHYLIDDISDIDKYLIDKIKTLMKCDG